MTNETIQDPGYDTQEESAMTREEIFNSVSVIDPRVKALVRRRAYVMSDRLRRHKLLRRVKYDPMTASADIRDVIRDDKLLRRVKYDPMTASADIRDVIRGA